MADFRPMWYHMVFRPGVTVRPLAAAHSNSAKGCTWCQFEFCSAKLDEVTTPVGYEALAPGNCWPVVRSASRLWRWVREPSYQKPVRSKPASNCLVALNTSPHTRYMLSLK